MIGQFDVVLMVTSAVLGQFSLSGDSPYLFGWIAHRPEGKGEPWKGSQQGAGVRCEQIWRISAGQGGGCMVCVRR